MFKILNFVASENFQLVGCEEISDMQFYCLPTFQNITEFCDLSIKCSCFRNDR